MRAHAIALLALPAMLGAAVAGCFSQYDGDCNRDVDSQCFWKAQPVCGNGEVDEGEACDDGNTEDCDGCRADCSAEETGCGDGFLCAGEQCDDGNDGAGDGCFECQCERGDLPATMTQIYGYTANAHCYARVHGPQKSWTSAGDACAQWGGTLVGFATAEEYQSVTFNLPGTASVWTGGSAQATPGEFAWANGEPWLEDPPWAAGQPGADSAACVLVTKAGELQTEDCAALSGYICERDLAAP